MAVEVAPPHCSVEDLPHSGTSAVTANAHRNQLLMMSRAISFIWIAQLYWMWANCLMLLLSIYLVFQEIQSSWWKLALSLKHEWRLFTKDSTFLPFYSPTSFLLFYCSTELPLPGSRSFVASAFDPNDPQARVRVKMAPKLTLTAVTTQQRDREICRIFYFNPETFLSSHKNYW